MEVNWTNLESIIDNYCQKLYQYCYRMLRNKEDAEDILQDVFLKINILLSSKKNIELHNGYIYKIAYNKCLNKIKRDKILKFVSFQSTGIEDVQSVKDIYFENELSEELNTIMSFLKAEERALLIFRAIHNMDYEEISMILGKSTVALRKQYERTRNKIQKILKEREDVFGEKI